MPKADTLADSFVLGRVDPDLWLVVGTPETKSGELELQEGEGIVSKDFYDLSGSYFFLKVRVTDEESNLILAAQFPDGWAEFRLAGSDLIFSIKDLTETFQEKIPYDQAVHQWWRIRENYNTLYFDTSRDGAGWTNRWQHSRRTNVREAQIGVFYGGGTGFGYGPFGSGPFGGGGYVPGTYGTGKYGVGSYGGELL